MADNRGKSLVLLMMKLLEEDSSTKEVERKQWQRQWFTRREEKGAYYKIFNDHGKK